MNSLSDYLILIVVIYLIGIVATIGAVRLADQLGSDMFRSREKKGHPDVTFTTVMIFLWPLGLVAVLGVFTGICFGKLWVDFLYKLLQGKKQ